MHITLLSISVIVLSYSRGWCGSRISSLITSIAHEFAVEFSEEDVWKEAHGLGEQKAKNDGNREWEMVLEWHYEACEEGQCPETVTHIAPKSTLLRHFVNSWIKFLVYLASDHPGHGVKCDPATGNELAV